MYFYYLHRHPWFSFVINIYIHLFAFSEKDTENDEELIQESVKNNKVITKKKNIDIFSTFEHIGFDMKIQRQLSLLSKTLLSVIDK